LGFPRILFGALLLLAIHAPLAAQSVLYVQNGGKFSQVIRADGAVPYVYEDGKWSADMDKACLLKPAADYLPLVVTVKNRYFGKGRKAISEDGPADVIELKTGRFVFNADFESPVALDDVFLVLELKGKDEDGTLYLWGLGHLAAHTDRSVSLDRTVDRLLTGLHCVVHVFVGGQEALNTTMPEARREAALDRMVASRVEALKDGAIRPLLAFPPEYPAAVTSGVKGQAVVTFRVDPRGRVLEPTVASATDPAFGVAAVDAIRQWRFVPRVSGGVPVESMAQLPFIFDPPS